MPASPRMRGRPGRLSYQLVFLGILVVAAGARAASGAGGGATPARSGTAAAFRDQGSGVQVVARVAVPATVGGRGTAAIVAQALAEQGWPLAVLDSVKGAVASQWLYFRQGANTLAARPGASQPSTASCWIRVRLVAQPMPTTRDSLLMGAQAWLGERVGTGAALEYARSLFDALEKDVLTGGPAVRAGEGNLKRLLNYTPEGDFLVCGAHATPTDHM